MSEGRPAAVVGAGTLGRRIALTLATQGGEVRLVDRSPEQLAEAVAFAERELPRLLARRGDGVAGLVTGADGLTGAVAGAWLVVESLPEDLALKRQVFADLDRLAPADAILATNSSSYPSSGLVDGLARPERVVNLHFFMPPYNDAVEVMSCGRTDRAVLDRLLAALPAYGLEPFEARAESVGFVYNRIWAAIKREALSVVAEGVATPAEVDRLFTKTLGASYGPFRGMDAVGLDVVLDIEEHYAKVRDGIPEAPRDLLREQIAQGRLGIKTGRGFYEDYGPPPSGRSARGDERDG